MPGFGVGSPLPQILASVFLNASAQILLRIGARASADAPSGRGPMALLALLASPSVLLGLAAYGVSLMLWLGVLQRTEASYAYPFLGLGFVFVALAGWLLLGEALSAQRLAATALIVVGVVFLART